MVKHNRGIPLGEWSGSDATKQLEATIKAFNEQANAQTKTMITLTKAIPGLTAAMTLAVLFQIYMAGREMKWW